MGSEGCQESVGGMNGVSKINGDHRFGTHLRRALWVGWEFNKGTMGLTGTSVPGESCPDPWPSSSCPEISQFISPSMSLEIFKLLSPALELRVSSLRATPSSPIVLCLSQSNPVDCHSHMSWDLSSWHLCPELESLIWSLVPSLLRGDLHNWDTPLCLNYHIVVTGSTWSVSPANLDVDSSL